MLKNITLGQYFPGDSVVHRLDPRTRKRMPMPVMLAASTIYASTMA